ncbi:MAG TPA: ATP phosphoribosyltransferase [Chloroflexia bacterium]|nr:ATP phosphoribosyltransferase [Chloroflexia bacterium]
MSNGSNLNGTRLSSNSNNEEQPRLRLAIQKEGRLTDHTLNLLRNVGLDFDSYKQRLFSHVRNFEMDILFSRDDDIPEYLATGTADLGVVGQNLLFEEGVEVTELQPVGFGHCSLVVAVPKESGITDPRQLAGKKVATSYPKSAQKYLKSIGIEAEVIELSGAVELAPNLGVANGIVEITATGSSLALNDLVPIETILKSEAVLAANKQSMEHPYKARNIERLLVRIRAALTARQFKYIVMNTPRDALDKVISVVPGLKSPTVVPLADPNWVAVHTVVKQEIFWDVMEQLREAGAGGILVVPIEQIIM